MPTRCSKRRCIAKIRRSKVLQPTCFTPRRGRGNVHSHMSRLSTGLRQHEPEISPAKTKGIKANKSEPESAIRLELPSRFIPTQQFPNGNVPASRQSTQTAHLMQVAKHKPAVAASDEHLGAKPAPNPPNEKIPFTIRKIPALQPFFQCCILLNKRRGFPDVSPSAKVSLSFRGSLIGSFLHFPPDHPPTKPLERACWKAGPAALPRAALQSAPQVPAI